MIITATFTGANSLGYENGKEYQLKVANLQGISVVKRLDGTGKCPYLSLSAFLKNWNNIRIQPHLPQTNVSGSFKEWYLEFRNEMAKSFGVNYSISIASWTFSENHKHYYDRGLTPKEAVLEYAASKNCH